MLRLQFGAAAAACLAIGAEHIDTPRRRSAVQVRLSFVGMRAG